MFPKIKQLIVLPKIYDPVKEIGIEIEMEGKQLYIKRNRMWQQKRDGSLRGRESVEYVLAAPIERKNVNKELQKLIAMLAFESKDGEYRKAILTPSDRCGVHIHINVQQLTFQQVFNFISLYLMFEQVIVGYCGESREGNLFCLRASDAEAFIDQMIECRRKSDLKELKYGRGNAELRYSSINPNALFKFGSLEFRSLRTPSNLMEINEWVSILYQVKEASLLYDDPIRFIELYSMRGEDRFFDDIMGPVANLLRKKVKDVDQKLMDGVRLIQDVAYTQVEIQPETLTDLGLQPVKKVYRRFVDAGYVDQPDDRDM